MDYITVTAKTLDDAITDALVQLGVTSDQLDYEVIEKGSAGFLGIGVKQAVIKARKKVEEPEVKEEPVKEVKKDTESVKDHAGHTEKPAKEKKHKKRAGVRPSDEPRSCTPVFCYGKCGKIRLFFHLAG